MVLQAVHDSWSFTFVFCRNCSIHKLCSVGEESLPFVFCGGGVECIDVDSVGEESFVILCLVECIDVDN